MKLYFHLLVILVIIEGILPLNIRKKSIKSLDNGPIQKNSQFSYESSPEEIYPFNIYPNYRFSQTKLNERENLNAYNQIQSESSETSQAGDDKPIFTLNIHAPQETTDDIIDSIKDLKKLVNDERKAADDDFLVEKKKLVEAQRIRVRDIVHSAFEAVNSLIPNPIKGAIRNTLSEKKN